MEGLTRRPTSNICCLFPEILAIIFNYLDVRDKGRVACVCTAWRDASYNRLVWKGVVARLHLRQASPSLFPSLVQRGIRRIQILSLKRSLKDVMVGIPNLEVLDISGCYNVRDDALRHALAHELPRLTSLNLSLCKQITDNTVQRMSQYLKNLEVLELGGCANLTSSGLLLLAWELRKLKVLNLRSCRCISDQGIGHLAGINRNMGPHGALALEELVLQDCQKLTDQSLKYMSVGLTSLRVLNLSFCSGVSDSGLRYLAKMPTLRELNLRSCDGVSDMGVGYLAQGGSRVTAIDLSFCGVADQGVIHISQGLYHLRTLSLCNCNISDDSLQRLVRTCHDLDTLNIGQCSRITDVGLQALSQHLQHLRCIDLYGCTKITTVGLEKIMQMKKLETLNLGLWQKR